MSQPQTPSVSTLEAPAEAPAAAPEPQPEGLSGHARAGAPAAPPPPEDQDSGGREIRIGLLIAAAFFVGFGGWAALTPLDAAVTAPGTVVVSGNRQTVQHRDGGTVSGLYVAEGQRVEQGDVLIDLATAELLAQERALMGLSLEMEALRARLLAETAGRRTVEAPAHWAALDAPFAESAAAILQRQQRELQIRAQSGGAQQNVLAERQDQLRARIQGYRDQIAALERQAVLIADELVGVRELADRGLTPMPRVRALERTQAEIDGRKAELAALIEQAREGIGESRMQGLAIRDNRSEEIARELRETETRLADVTPRLDAVRAEIERARIRAPATGLVVGLQVFTVGGVVRPGEPLMDVVPEAQPLVLEAQVAPQDADDLQIGMRTQVRFVAFTGTQLPLVHGAVSRISADRLLDERTGASYFLAEVTVAPSELEKLAAAGRSGEELQLRAGLPVDVVVPLRSRTALQYLLEPLDRQLWRSFREH